MSGTLTIFQREITSYFSSLFAYLIAFAVLLVTGILFINDAFAMIFFAPLLTMRLFAEERREGTIELLLTSPASEVGIVLGKFLGAWFYFTVILALTFVYQIILLNITQPDIGHAFAAYIGIWLYGGACLAVGIFFSSLTENQIVAAFLASSLLFILWIGDQVGQIITNVDVARVIRQLTLQGHFSTSFAAGLLRAEDIVFFAGIITLMLFLTIRTVEANRWR
jgi:ABC-2 type transport system permease protein